MGAGASHQAAKALEKEDDADAEAYFKQLDASGDGNLSVIELYNHTREVHVDWPPDEIKATIELFDENKDGKISLAEYKKALRAMEKKAVKSKGKGRKEEKGKMMKRDFTWKGHRKGLADEKAAEEEKKAVAMSALDDLDLPSVEQRKAQHWAQMEPKEVWGPIVLRRKMPWNADGEDALTEAMARAQSLGKTPLLLDPSSAADETELDKYLKETAAEVRGRAPARSAQVPAARLVRAGAAPRAARGAQVLDAAKMVADEASEARSRQTVMKDARKQLVAAMKAGALFAVRIGGKPIHFTGDGLNGDDTLPLSVFDARKVAELAPYKAAAAKVEKTDLDADNLRGLAESGHPWSAVLREMDLDNELSFVVGDAFRVAATTSIGAGVDPAERFAEVRGKLLSCLPNVSERFQPILVRA